MYCGRISIDVSNAPIFGAHFLKHFKPKKFILNFETKDDKNDKEDYNNPHCHFIAEYETEPTKQQMSEFMKKYKQLCPHAGVHYYHKKMKVDFHRALAYNIKQDYLIMATTNFTDEDFNKANEYIDKYEEDKKLNALMKLDKLFKEDIKLNEKINAHKDANIKLNEIKLFIYKQYSAWKTEISGGRVKSMSIQLCIMNNILTDGELLIDIML